MSDSPSGNTHEVIAELFRAMNTKIADRAQGNFRPWADALPYVNGGLFSGSPDLRHAHARNDETLERIYIGRTFRNDTERLEKLFALYTRMTASGAAAASKTSKAKSSKVHR